MKALLLDMPVSPLLLDVLRAHGHSGIHAYTIGAGRAADADLLALAYNEHRIVIRADLDFPQLLALSAASGPGIILFRGGSYSDVEMCALLERVPQIVPAETLKHSICVVDKRRVRVTPLPLRKKNRNIIKDAALE